MFGVRVMPRTYRSALQNTVKRRTVNDIEPIRERSVCEGWGYHTIRHAVVPCPGNGPALSRITPVQPFLVCRVPSLAPTALTDNISGVLSAFLASEMADFVGAASPDMYVDIYECIFELRRVSRT